MNTRAPTVEDALPIATYAFGEFRLDVRRARFLRGDAEVPLTPKAFTVLEYLVRRPGVLVDKQALLTAAWPNVIVEEGNLSQTVYLLRRALGEHPADHRYIVTVPGRGYRFVADVVAVDEPAVAATVSVPAAAPRHRWTAWAMAAGVLLAVVGGLLLRNVSGVRETTPAAAQVSSPRAANASEAPTVAKAPVASTVRDAELTRAKFLFSRREPGDLDSARAAFEEVRARDPRNAGAWAGIAGVFIVEAQNGAADPAASFAAARAAAERALTLDPMNAAAHVRMAALRTYAGDARGAQASLAAARRFGPNEPLVLACDAEQAVERGDFAAAADLVRRSVDVEPMNMAARMNLVTFLLAAHRADEAEAEAERAYEVYPVDGAALALGELRLARGDVVGASRMFSGLRGIEARERATALLSAASHSRSKEAEAALQRLAARVGHADPFAVAEAYALRGDRDRAFEWLERAAPSDGGAGVAPPSRPRWTMRTSPLLAQLHADPRWYAWERATVGEGGSRVSNDP